MKNLKPIFAALLILLLVLSPTLVFASSVMWSRTYEIERERVLLSAYSLIDTSDGGYAMVGNIFSFFTGEGLIWVAKTDGYGVIPEFPSWAPMLLTLITLTVILAVYRKKLPKTPNN